MSDVTGWTVFRRRWGSRRPAGRVVLLLGLLWWMAWPAGASGADREDNAVYAAKVTRVFDGDTLWVRPLAGGRYRKLRLDGIDAPEICQPGGVASRDALAALVSDREVLVAVRRHDDYGRAVVKLSVRGEDVSARLVSEGHAWSYRWRRSLGPYAQEEAAARRLGKGLFSDPDPELPLDFRRRYGPCPGP